MKNITIILPVHELEADDVLLFRNAVLSVQYFKEDVKLAIVFPEKLEVNIDELLSKLKELKDLEIQKVINTTKNTDFLSQMNLAIDACDTEWFSILEIDDEYRSLWLPSMKEHVEKYPDVDVFLPIVRDVNVEGKFVGYMNESVWAYGFSNTQGYLDNELLVEYQNFQTSGGLYRTEVIKTNGKFKDNIKLTFSYELLLRLTYHGVKVMVVPRLSYQHVNLRENSLFWKYKNDKKMLLDEAEVKFWLETAKKEYYFKNKRDIKYVKS